MYKFLNLKDNKIVSGLNEDFVWEVGKWYKTKGKLNICHNGFHCSEKPLDALGYVNGEIIAEIEISGKSIKENDKQCWQNMKLVKAYYWTKKDSVALAIYAAELVIDMYEKQYPDDKRPRKAIEAAKKVLENDNAKNRAAAWAAAEAAAEEVVEAARAARAAARAAWAAAWAAARAAEAAAWAAAWAAARAAEAAAWAAARDKINDWIINRIKELKEI